MPIAHEDSSKIFHSVVKSATVESQRDQECICNAVLAVQRCRNGMAQFNFVFLMSRSVHKEKSLDPKKVILDFMGPEIQVHVALQDNRTIGPFETTQHYVRRRVRS